MRPGLLWLGVLAMAFLPGATAATAATATVDPGLVLPGAPLRILVDIPEDSLAEATVSEHVVCTVTTPSDATLTACDHTAPTAEAHVAANGNSRQYSFSWIAPREVGRYRLHVDVTSTLTVAPLIQSYAADAAFTVTNRTDASGNPIPGGSGAPGQDGANGANGAKGGNGANGANGSPAASGGPGGQGPPGLPGTSPAPFPGHAHDGFDSARLATTSGLGTAVLTVALVAARHRPTGVKA